MKFVKVFPTPVGVFLEHFVDLTLEFYLPHARGGVSTVTIFRSWVDVSSPRPWGCFRQTSVQDHCLSIFPTPVGVFPSEHPDPQKGSRLPHTRGGVSERPESESA